jgi:hypothetical protein
MPDAAYWQSIYRRNVIFVAQYYLTAAAAMLTGLLLGPGDSAGRFLDFEVNKPRLIPDPPGGAAEDEHAA